MKSAVLHTSGDAPVAGWRRVTVAMVCDGIGDVVAGAFISTTRFAESLTARGHRVILVSSGSHGERAAVEYRGMRIYRFPSVLVPWSDRRLYLAVPSVHRLRTILRKERVDLVHVLIPMPLGLAAVRVAKSMRLPVVMHSHTQPENIFMNWPRFPGRDALCRRFRAYLNWIYRQADVMIHPSSFSQRQFPELAGRHHVVISNGVDREQFRPTPPDAFMRRFHLSPANQHLLYVGRLHREKDVETLIRALPIIRQHRPETHLVIVGQGYEQPALLALARRQRIAANLTFCGFVADSDLAAAYAAGDLFVLPSIAELESMAVLEAMACGKPLLIVDSPNSAATELVTDNGLLFRARDPGDLAAQASRLLSNPEQLRAMGDASLNQSRRFNIRDSAAALESVYDFLVRLNAFSESGDGTSNDPRKRYRIT